MHGMHMHRSIFELSLKHQLIMMPLQHVHVYIYMYAYIFTYNVYTQLQRQLKLQKNDHIHGTPTTAKYWMHPCVPLIVYTVALFKAN